MTSPHARPRTALARAGAVGLAAPLLFALATPAHAAPGDNGDVKIHRSTTPVNDERDEPKVCQFYLDAFNFDTLQLVSFTIDQQPPTGNAQVLSGAIVLTNGTGATQTYTLPNGHYKLNWTFVGENGNGKHKVFDVDCTPQPTGSPTAPPSGSPTSTASASTKPSHKPTGGVAAGGGGSSRDVDGLEVAAGGILAVAAGWFALRTRRRARRDDAS